MRFGKHKLDKNGCWRLLWRSLEGKLFIVWELRNLSRHSILYLDYKLSSAEVRCPGTEIMALVIQNKKTWNWTLLGFFIYLSSQNKLQYNNQIIIFKPKQDTLNSDTQSHRSNRNPLETVLMFLIHSLKHNTILHLRVCTAALPLIRQK